MPVPKRRTSSAKRDRRRSHDALSLPASGICPNCSAPTTPHRACASCGQYKGRQIIAMKSDDE